MSPNFLLKTLIYANTKSENMNLYFQELKCFLQNFGILVPFRLALVFPNILCMIFLQKVTLKSFNLINRNFKLTYHRMTSLKNLSFNNGVEFK